MQYKKRTDEGSRDYSNLLGLHTLPWQTDSWNSYVRTFNETTDKVVAAQSTVKTRVDASKLSKDKTRLLQFCPTIDLLEKVFERLLPQETSVRDAMTPEEMVRHLAKVDIQNVLKTFKPEEISGKIRMPSVLASEAWAEFASAQFKLHENIVDEVRMFNEARKKASFLPQPRPAALFALAQDDAVTMPGELHKCYEKLSRGRLHWAEFAADPANDEHELKQAKYEILALALAGFVHVHGCHITLRQFPDRGNALLPHLPLLQALDPSVVIASFSQLVPVGPEHPMLHYSLPHAKILADLLKSYAEGAEVGVEQVASCVDPFLQPSLPDTPSQAFQTFVYLRKTYY